MCNFRQRMQVISAQSAEPFETDLGHRGTVFATHLLTVQFRQRMQVGQRMKVIAVQSSVCEFVRKLPQCPNR